MDNHKQSLPVKTLIDYLDYWEIPYFIEDGIDGYNTAEEINKIDEYVFEPNIPHDWKYKYDRGSEFDGRYITHFVTIGDRILVWGIYGTYETPTGEPDYSKNDKAVRIV